MRWEATQLEPIPLLFVSVGLITAALLLLSLPMLTRATDPSLPRLIYATLFFMLALLVAISCSLLKYKALSFLKARNSPASRLSAVVAFAIALEVMALTALAVALYALYVGPGAEAYVLPTANASGESPSFCLEVNQWLTDRFLSRGRPLPVTNTTPICQPTAPANATPAWAMNIRDPLRSAAPAALTPAVIAVVTVVLVAALLGLPPCGG